MGHFGNNGWTCLGWWKEHCLFGVSSQRCFARESLGEPSNFQVVAFGSQQRVNRIKESSVMNVHFESMEVFYFLGILT